MHPLLVKGVVIGPVTNGFLRWRQRVRQYSPCTRPRGRAQRAHAHASAYHRVVGILALDHANAVRNEVRRPPRTCIREGAGSARVEQSHSTPSQQRIVKTAPAARRPATKHSPAPFISSTGVPFFVAADTVAIVPGPPCAAARGCVRARGRPVLARAQT